MSKHGFGSNLSKGGGKARTAKPTATRNDLDTVRQAQAIQSDPARVKAMAAEHAAQAAALGKVGKK